MSVRNNQSRTLSGLTTIKADQLELPQSRRAIAIKGQYGVAGDVLQKSSTNKLQWGKVDDIEIPDGSIEGSKLAPDITFTTTGNISANQFIATDKFAQTGTSTNTFNGALQLPKLTTTNNQIEAINVANGGLVNLYQYTADGGPLTISLAGQTGIITCEDININNHTGTIEFANIRTNSLTIPKTGAGQVVLNTDGLLISGQKTNGLSAGGCGGELAFLSINGIHGALSLLIRGNVQILPGTGDTAQDGDLTITSGDLNMTNGNAVLTTGNLTLTGGNLVVSKATSINSIAGQTTISGNFISTGGADFTGVNSVDVINGGQVKFRLNPTTNDFTAGYGDIISTAGSLTSNRVGAKPAPDGSSTYTEWGLNLTDANTHGYIGGNLIVNGKIYGDVIGAITEEEVDCQRITCRTASPSIGGITGMILGTGAIISNDTTGINELTIDADTSGILCNNVSILNNTLSEQALAVAGNVTLSTGSNRTTTIGNVGNSGQTLEILCQNVNIGETAGNQNSNVLNYRGGIHTFTGATINLSTRLGYTGEGCNLHGSAGQGTNNIYKNNIRYFNLDGQQISHNLAGTIQNFVILRSNTERTIQVAKQVGFSNSSTVFTVADTYFFENITAPTSVAKLDFDLFFRHRSGVPDLYVRVDTSKTGATPYNASFLKPRILVNTAFGGAGNEIRVTHSYFIVGLIPGNDYSFYPKFADTTSGSAIGDLKYGDAFGEMSLKLTWLEAYLGVAGDPYAPSSGDDY